MLRATSLSIVLLALCACGSRAPAPQAAGVAAPDARGPTANAGNHAFQAAITADDFAAHVQALASDGFAGRGPGGIGEDRTIEYIKAQFARIGLQPGNGSDWFQPVSMVETTADESATLDIAVGGAQQVLKFGGDMVIGTRTGQPQVSIKDSDLVFVG